MKVADRDADGTADHLYFGDLGGQLFRIDLNNAVGNKGSLVHRVVQLADFNATDTANGIRFYEPPSFAPSYDTLNKITTGLLAISSGNQSFPMGEGTQDYAYMLFDSDVMQSDLFSRTVEKTYTTKNMTHLVELTNNKAVTDISSQISPTGSKMGWYFKLPSYLPARLGAKGMVRTSIVDYVLNVTVFDPTRNNLTCGSGIKGATTTYRMCLPYGACGTDATTYIAKNYLGGGIGKPLLTGSVHKSLSYANDTSLTDSTTPSGVGAALKDSYTFESKVKPMHRWREVTSEKYK
jgi:type IV pilus assembly protein PilY1